VEIGEENKSDEDSKGHDENEHPGDLLSPPTQRKVGKSVIGKELKPSLSRHSTRSEMPGVQEVLKRTVSLSGASVHGA
jgi:hypothetical protein